jgi:DNA-binding NtrC family response regulator
MANYEVFEAGGGKEALEALESITVDAVITDLKMPGMDGVELIKAIRERHRNLLCLVLTGYASIETAVLAMKAGAYDYIKKPVNREELTISLGKGLEFRRLMRENTSLKRELRKKYSFEGLIGDSDAMQGVYSLIEKVADSDSTVLVLGESGTGKELAARTIHYNSSRSDKPMVPINCGAIPESLLETELFGHEKGAFTGAYSARAGRFEMANGGTIFLDEIGEMSPLLQVKLLRVLQEREFERVGGSRTVKVDVRVIAATNIDLENAVAEKKFREDLYYRINVIPITMPPLRERVGDIPLLANRFLEVFGKKKGKTVEGISEEAMSVLKAYSWPGNVRELENLIERIVILKKEGVINVSDLPEKFVPVGEKAALNPVVIPEEGINLEAFVDQFENRLIMQALDKAGGVKSRAAQLLQMNRTTLVEKMKKKGLSKTE